MIAILNDKQGLALINNTPQGPERSRAQMRYIEKGITVTEKTGYFFGIVSSWMVAIMMLLVGFEVFMRYVFNKPPLIADEFAAYLLVAISFLGISQAFLEKSHVRITFLVDKIPKKVTKFLRLIILFLTEIFIIVMCFAGYKYLSFSFLINERSPSWINFPYKYPQSTILIGFIIFGLVLFGQIIRLLFYPINNQK